MLFIALVRWDEYHEILSAIIFKRELKNSGKEPVSKHVKMISAQHSSNNGKN